MFFFLYYSLNNDRRTSLLAQWIRIHLSMQETQVRSLVWEDPTCTEQQSPCATTPEPSCLKAVLHRERSRRNEKPGRGSQEQRCSPQAEKVQAQPQRRSTAKANKHHKKKITTKAFRGHPSQSMCLVPQHYLQAPSEAGTMQSIPGSFTDLTPCLSCCLYPVNPGQGLAVSTDACLHGCNIQRAQNDKSDMPWSMQPP